MFMKFQLLEAASREMRAVGSEQLGAMSGNGRHGRVLKSQTCSVSHHRELLVAFVDILRGEAAMG